MAAPLSFTLTARGPFSLAESAEFADGFLPAPAQASSRDGAGARVLLALTGDDGRPAAVEVTQDGDRLTGRAATELTAKEVAGHTARVLSVDIDAEGFAAVGDRDPVVASLQREFPGRRPVLFATPFEAAVWSVLSQRSSRAGAATVRARLAATLGTTLELDGTQLTAFPGPSAFVDRDDLEGVPVVKAQRIRAIARATLDGHLDVAALRAMDQDAAVSHLCELPGVGPFSAALILIRGAGHPDVLLTPIARLRHAVATAYGLDPGALDDAQPERIGAPWRPYRSWVLFLLRNRLDRPVA